MSRDARFRHLADKTTRLKGLQELLYVAGHLVDFVSDDRTALLPDGSFRPMRWSTPVSEWGPFAGLVVPSAGRATWHPADEEPFTYLELTLQDLAVR